MEQKQKSRSRLDRCMSGEIRAMEGQDRTYRLSFSSENPYNRWFGSEILDHREGAVNLTRLNEIGTVLFNHNRDQVVGRIQRAWVENGRGECEIVFDTDEASEVIRGKVESGSLRGVSVGYTVGSWEDVTEGHMSADGRFAGPCSIARAWTPFEVSIVSVPADETVGVGRSMDEETEPENRTDHLSTAWRQMQFNKNMRGE